jgi:hypothetical protein
MCLPSSFDGASRLFIMLCRKLIEGWPGRGDWYGEDPSLFWPVDYIQGEK